MALPVTSEIVFDVVCEDLGGYAADCSFEDISVMADTWEDLLRGQSRRRTPLPKRPQARFDTAAPGARRRHLPGVIRH